MHDESLQYKNLHNEILSDDIDKLITSYLEGTIDSSSFQILTDWVKESEEHRLYVKQRMDIWMSAGVSDSVHPFNKEKGYDRFLERVGKTSQKPTKIYTFSWKPVLRVAAMILILMLPFMGYWGGRQTLKNQFADIIVEAPLGASTKLYLPDGTLVWLNAGSQLAYSQGFGVDGRDVELKGEGYFEVAKNKALPFKVHTKEMQLRVLGTKFNFKNYEDDDEIVVDLLEGKVALQNSLLDEQEMNMDCDEQVVLNKRTGEWNKTISEASNSNLWTTDELFFNEDTLEDIAKMLMRSYNVKIEVADSLKNRRFYGDFQVSTSTIREILEEISMTNRMQFVYENGVYKIY